jgi:hypothetical protein
MLFAAVHHGLACGAFLELRTMQLACAAGLQRARALRLSNQISLQPGAFSLNLARQLLSITRVLN